MRSSSSPIPLLSASALLLLLPLLHCRSAAVTAATLDNVAVQWNSLLSSIICTRGILFTDANTYFSQMHLAQWHALVALSNTGKGSSRSGGVTEQAAVAYASRAVLAQYLTFETEPLLDPLLLQQLQIIKPSASEKRAAREIGEAVALCLVQSRVGGDPGKDFLLDSATAALDHPNPPPVREQLQRSGESVLQPRREGEDLHPPGPYRLQETRLEQVQTPRSAVDGVGH